LKRLKFFILSILIFSISLPMSCTNETTTPPQEITRGLTVKDVSIGMQTPAFLSIFPEAGLSKDFQWKRNTVLHDLEGEWTYTFGQNNLSWYVFNSYQTPSEENFNRALSATRQIISHYSEQYGTPLTIQEGILEYRDPAVDYHWGYNVLNASWSHNGETIRVGFSFLGGEQEKYQFLVTIEVTG
jgi:hypothetical protein